MTSGERRFAQRLESHLEDDYLCWYDVPVGPTGSHPDFVVLHPRRGLLVVEVKDWKLGTIQSMDKSSVALVTERGIKRQLNPLEQARHYAHQVKQVLEGDRSLLAAADSPYAGRLVFPWGFGVVLANISRKAFQETNLIEVLPAERVICQDEMVESTEPERFQRQLWSMFGVTFPCTLSMPPVDRIRWHMFPDIRVNSVQATLLADREGESANPVSDLLRVMDLQQERLARGLGEGHRVIHGVAGSGKTMILGYRCAHLAPLLLKPILVLCYNAVLATRLDHFVSERNLDEKVNVRNFHGWCFDQLKLYHVPLPENGATDFADQLVKKVIDGVERGQIPRAQYGAVLIDEGHDFQPEWLQLVVQMVDPNTNSLLVLYDDAQTLYGEKTRRNFSFAKLGIQARGRTTILRLNYRNTAEVLTVAYQFAREFLAPKDAEEDDIPLLSPQSAGRHGASPEIVPLTSFDDEVDYVAKRLSGFSKLGVAWSDTAVIYRSRFIGERVTEKLRRSGIPVNWLGESKASRRFTANENSVKVMTMHGSKGLEFSVVIVPGVGYMPHPREDVDSEARLLYVAMTRSMDRLVLTCHTESAFVVRLREAVRVAA